MRLHEKTEFDFDTFDPKAYLKEYYTTIDFENDQLLRFFCSCYQDIAPRSTLLEFGCGPTLYSLITAATKVEIIHVCDALAANLHEICLWQRGSDDAFDWEPFIRRALQIEGKSAITREDICRRTALLRKKLVRFSDCNAFRNPPLPENYGDGYDIVQVNFVPESITSSLIRWELAIQNILTLLKPRGTFVLTTLKNAEYYQVHHRNYPAVNIDESLLIKTLTRWGFSEANITTQTIAANPPYRGYSGMIFTKACL